MHDDPGFARRVFLAACAWGAAFAGPAAVLVAHGQAASSLLFFAAVDATFLVLFLVAYARTPALSLREQAG